ncbi:MAG TPA: glycosyltransferase family 39 protein [Candidatus Acidoferrum sp.]|nr:glycosyltransferase family 39 protein [Candidatus Acidoferrum sp.]
MTSALRKAATSLLLIVLVAIAARTAFAIYEIKQFPPRILNIVPFQTETGHIAYSIAAGKGFSSPFQRDTGATAWVAPVYPYLLAGIFKVFGVYTLGAFYAALLLNIFFSACACIPLFYSGKRIAGAGVASVAGWAWALFPNAILIPFEWIWDTCLSVLLLTLLLSATLALAEKSRARDWCGYGLLWGIALLTNPALALPLPFLLLWFAYRSSAITSAHRFLRPALAAAIAIFCCVPWTIRNYIQFHHFVPLRSNFAFELYVGNNENYDDANRGRPAVVTQDREIVRYLRIGETAFLQEEMQKAAAFIWTHPRTEISLIANRFVDFWFGSARPLQTFRQADSAWIQGILLCNDLAPLFMLAGIAAIIVRKNRYAFPVVILPIVFPLTYYVTHTSLRYRHPIDPVVLLLCAIALHEGWAWRERILRGTPTVAPRDGQYK